MNANACENYVRNTCNRKDFSESKLKKQKELRKGKERKNNRQAERKKYEKKNEKIEREIPKNELYIPKKRRWRKTEDKE